MKKSEAKIGMKVTSSIHIFAIIYTVSEITPDEVGHHLTYTRLDGTVVSGGWLHYSLLEHPTAKQLLLRVTELEDAIKEKS
jgi:hypothetical protein